MGNLGLMLREIPLSEARRLAAVAEQAGFTHIFVPETNLIPRQVYTPDTFLMVQAILQATSAVTAGTGVLASPLRSAHAAGILAATINDESGGRFVLGAGTSHRAAIEALGLEYPPSPLGYMREYARQLALISGIGAGFPVFLGALGPKMMSLAARECDGVMLNWVPVTAAPDICGALRADVAAAGKEQFSTVLFIRVGPSDVLRFQAVRNSERPSYRSHFQRMGLIDERGAFDVDALVSGACVAPADPYADAVSRYREAGVDIPCLTPVGMNADEIEKWLTP